MNISNEQYQRICKFLDTEMSIEEMQLFEVELENNAAMKEQLNFEQSVREVYFNKKNNTQAVSINKNKWLLIAAASVLGVVLTIFLWNKKTNQSDNIVTNNNTQPTAIDTVNKTTTQGKNIFSKYYTKAATTQDAPILLADALIDYENNNYDKLLALNENTIPQTRNNNDKNRTITLLNYYKGIAYIEKNNYDSAIHFFTKCISQNEYIEEKNNAQWYLALAYTKVNIEKAKEILKQIVNDTQHPKYKQAIEIIKELE